MYVTYSKGLFSQMWLSAEVLLLQFICIHHNIYSSIHYFTNPVKCCKGGANHSCHWERGKMPLGQVASPSQV